MEYSYFWQLLEVQCITELHGYNDVVSYVAWACNGQLETDVKIFTARQTGSFNFNFTPSQAFIKKPDLTDEQVIAWIWEQGVDRAAVEAAVKQMLDNLDAGA